MHARWKQSADLRAGFWFTALGTALLGPVLVAVVLLIDHHAGPPGAVGSLVLSPTSARTILGAIAGSLITIASLTSSLTIVTLQLLSNQYTPRAIRGFLRTRLSQAVFGTFVGIFVYCLLLLVAVRAPGEANDPFVPSLGVIVAIALALASLGMLVVFVHRLSQLIQVSTMTSSLTHETLVAIDTVHPQPFGRAPVTAPSTAGWTAERAHRAGYVQRVAADTLTGPAVVHVRPGDFVTTRSVIVSAPPGTSGMPAKAVLVGTERDLDQDPTFGVRQLVDIAVRALSPGINDPTTAVTCIHYLQQLLQTVVTRDLPAWTANGDVVVASRPLADYLAPIREIATYGHGDPRVDGELRAMLDAVAHAARDDGADPAAAEVSAFAEGL